MATAKVELVGVRKVFAAPTRKAPATAALEDVSLVLHDHEIVSLLGPSGCGKTTILNLIAGFTAPTDGAVRVNGQPVRGIGPDRLVVFQTPALFPWLDVWANVTFGVRHRGQRAADYAERARQALRSAGLEGFESHYPYQLSGGMRQRAQIARCLLSDPEVMLLDEPFGALDAQTRLEMQRWLLGIHLTYRPTILAITHDVEEALFLSERVYVMTPRPGRIRAEIAVPFPRPRPLALLGDIEFGRLRTTVLGLLHGQGAAAGAGAPSGDAGPMPVEASDA